MSERKVLNKYYPPDFDPTKIPKLKQGRNRQYSIRIMSPFNMRCNTCGEYIYKGKKFNSRKETVEDETYLGLYIFRFYIKCPRCVAEIAFKTDPHNTDYTLEAGATRNFEALRTAELQAEKEQKEKEEEEANNPMKVLENRTKASRQEMDMIETLEDLKQMNSRHAKLDHSQVIKLHQAYEEQLKRLQDEEDEDFVKSIFGSDSDDGYVRRLPDPDEEETVPRKMAKLEKPTDFLTKSDDGATDSSQSKKLGGFAKMSSGSKSTSKSALSMLVKRKQPQKPAGFAPATAASNAAEKEEKTANDTTTNGPKDNTENQEKSTEKKKEPEADNKTAAVVNSSINAENKKPVVSGLGLLGDYSDSSESEGSST